jgi:hypothetical protein
MENLEENVEHYVSSTDLRRLKEYLPAGDLPPQLLQCLICPTPWELLASLDVDVSNITSLKYVQDAKVETMMEKVAAMTITDVLQGSAETCEELEEIYNAVDEVTIVALGPVLALKAPRTSLSAPAGTSGTLRIPLSSIGNGQGVKLLHRGVYEGNMAVLYDDTGCIWALVVLVGWGMKDSTRGTLVQIVRVLSRPVTLLLLDPHFARHRTSMCESDALVASFYYSQFYAGLVGQTETNLALLEDKRNVRILSTLLHCSVYPNLEEHLILHRDGFKVPCVRTVT